MSFQHQLVSQKWCEVSLILHTADIRYHPEHTHHAQRNPEAHVQNEAQQFGILVEILDHVGGRCLQHGRDAQYSDANHNGDLDVVAVVEGVADLGELIVEDNQLFELIVDLEDAGSVEDVEPVVFGHVLLVVRRELIVARINRPCDQSGQEYVQFLKPILQYFRVENHLEHEKEEERVDKRGDQRLIETLNQ
uniref:Uncharacterized protein n=1 Tax=Cacopsylla melanoneura TaxID=428564 RepID=A0A8D8LLQ3_9HEMI